MALSLITRDAVYVATTVAHNDAEQHMVAGCRTAQGGAAVATVPEALRGVGHVRAGAARAGRHTDLALAHRVSYMISVTTYYETRGARSFSLHTIHG